MSEASGSVPAAPSAPYLHEVSTRTDLVDWGVQPNAIVVKSFMVSKQLTK